MLRINDIAPRENLPPPSLYHEIKKKWFITLHASLDQ